MDFDAGIVGWEKLYAALEAVTVLAAGCENTDLAVGAVERMHESFRKIEQKGKLYIPADGVSETPDAN